MKKGKEKLRDIQSYGLEEFIQKYTEKFEQMKSLHAYPDVKGTIQLLLDITQDLEKVTVAWPVRCEGLYVVRVEEQPERRIYQAKTIKGDMETRFTIGDLTALGTQETTNDSGVYSLTLDVPDTSLTEINGQQEP